MSTTPDPDRQRAESAERWERAAAGWGQAAERVREFGMPVSAWMIDHAELQPGQRVLELAAGPGDTGFLAADLVQPGGTLVCSDASEPMLEIARDRARSQGIENVEFKQLQLEWIDLPTASVDRILCRWGIMLVVDPAAALQEARRVLRPGGRLAVAVWDEAGENPWATIPNRALIELGHATPIEDAAPGMFALAAPGRVRELLDSAGFVEVLVETVGIDRTQSDVEGFLAETRSLSMAFSDLVSRLPGDEQAAIHSRIAELAEPYRGADEKLTFPGRSLVAAASA